MLKENNDTKLRKNKLKKEFAKTILMILIVFGALYGGFYLFKLYMKTEYPIVVVTSNSMTPNINKGDLLFVKYIPPEDIKSGTHEDLKGDVIVYETKGIWPNPIDAPVVHRVINKFQENGTWYFNAQGDANPYPDPPNSPTLTVDIPADKIYGVVVGRIPAIGWIKIWLTETNLAIPIMIILGFLLFISIIYDLTHPEEEDNSKDQLKLKQEKLKKVKKEIDNQKIIEQNNQTQNINNKEFELGI